MTLDLFPLLLTLATTVIGAFVGAYMSARFSYAQTVFGEQDHRRREAADSAIPALVELRRLLRNAETSRSSAQWASATEEAYERLDDARHLFPSGLRHLKRSIRASVGEAVGAVAIADLDPRMLDYELSPYDHRWTGYAMEYLDNAIDRIREWRDTPRAQAALVAMGDYDDWLSTSGHYPPRIR